MEPFVYMAFSALLGGLMGLLSAYVIGRKLLNSDRFIDIFYDIIGEIGQNQDLKLQLYQIGGLLGSGVRSGVGIGKKSGKFGLEELATSLIGQFAQQYLTKAVGGNQTQPVTVEADPTQIT